MSRKKRKINAKGRNKETVGSFSKLPHRIQHSPAYMALTPNARSLLMELISLEKGENNGAFWLSEKDAAARMGVASRKTARSAFQELIDTGLIAMTKNAYFHVKTGSGRSRCWRLTWVYNYAERKPATNGWEGHEPRTKRTRLRITQAQTALKAYKRQYAEIRNTREKFPHTALNGNIERENFSCTKTSNHTKRGFSGKSKGENFMPHTAVTIGTEESGNANEVADTKHPLSDRASNTVSAKIARDENLVDNSDKPNRQQFNCSVESWKRRSWSLEMLRRSAVPLADNDNDLPPG